MKGGILGRTLRRTLALPTRRRILDRGGLGFDAWDGANTQANAHPGAGRHVDQGIKTELSDPALEHLVEARLG